MTNSDNEGAGSDRPPAAGGRPLVGRVVRVLPNRQVLVELGRGDQVVAHLSGAMRVAVVRLLAGDLVRVERSPFDARKGRIVGRADGAG